MATDNWINSENMLESLRKHMNKEMMEAAEPVIKEAVEEAEREIRKRLGAMFVGLIEQNFSMERNGTDLRILVKQVKNT